MVHKILGRIPMVHGYILVTDFAYRQSHLEFRDSCLYHRQSHFGTFAPLGFHNMHFYNGNKAQNAIVHIRYLLEAIFVDLVTKRHFAGKLAAFPLV